MKESIKKRIEAVRRGEVLVGYVDSMAGMIPVDWRSEPLYAISEVLSEQAGDREFETMSISAGIGFVNQAEKFGKELSGKQYTKYTVLRQGDFAYNKGNSKRYPQGCTYMLREREEAAVPNVFECFRIAQGYPEYYEQLFIHGFMNKQLTRKINHGVRDDGLLNLTDDDFYSTVLPIPPVSEQKKIAEILATCDRVIELKRLKINELSKLKQTFLQKIFPQKGNDVPEIRFKGFTAPWEQRKLGEVANSFEYGLNAAAKEFDGENKYIRITDIDDETRLFLNSDVTSPDYDLTIADNYQLKDGDILFARTGASVGKTFIYKPSDGLMYYAGFLIRARIKEETCSKFVFYNTLTEQYEKFIRITSQRSGQPGVNAQEYASFEFYLPSYDEQVRIGEFFANFDRLITLHQRELEEYEKLKKALMQLLLTGLVRVNA